MLADLASDFEPLYGVGHAAEVQADATSSVAAPAVQTTAGDYEPSDILVRFRTDATTLLAATTPFAASSETLPLVAGLQDVHLASGVSVDDALAAYRVRPDVLYAEPNYRLYADSIPNDTRFNELWGLNNAGQSSGTADADIDAAEAWDISTGSNNIVVGVIDTGVDYTHPDLAANIWTNPGEIAGNGIDDDGDGFVDDVHGYNFVANNGNPMDDHGHGTHVSGTIGAIGNNGQGVAGVNWHVQIMAIKFLDASGGGSDAGAIAAINYAALMHSRGVNIKLTSNSWGGGGFSQALQDAIAATQKQGMLFIAAAGNSNLNTDATPNYPSGYPLDNIISVAASDRNDGKASFSNYGASTVDLAAPGVDVLSTTPNNTYSVFSGTSMATPHVAGVAALGWSVAPSATYQQIRDAIFAGVDPNNAFRVGGPAPVATGGRLNALGTLQRLGLIVSNSTPASGSAVSSPPTSFAMNFSAAVDPASVQPTDFTVDGVAADNVMLDASHTTATFTYTASPATVQGKHTMHIAAGSIIRESNPAQAIVDFTGTFRYDAVAMQVAATSPPAGGAFTLPAPLTYDVTFNEAVDPASVQATDLTLSGISGASVSAVALLNNNTTARFTFGGVAAEGTLAATIAAGAVTDSFGNPNATTFSFTYLVDNGTVGFPVPLAAELPLGSLVYDRSTLGTIGPAGDADAFTLQLDAGQTLTVAASPTSNTLQPALELRDPSNNSIASATATVVGARAIIETVPINTTGLYTINVSASGGSVGAYVLKVALNVAEEVETPGTPPNDTPATAQNIDSSFVALGPGTSQGQRAATIGSDGGAAGAFSFANFENGTNGYAINNNSVPGDAAGWWHLSTRRGNETGHSSVTSFYYGNDSTGNYDTPGQANAGNITSPPITLTAAAAITLSFNYVLVNESPSWDVASVLVSSNGGTSFNSIASSKSTAQLPATTTWKTASFDLSAYAGQTILLRFNFDTIDSVLNTYEGWYVDDVQLSSPKPWTDYYSFTAQPNDTASVELKNLTGSGTQLFVEDASGQPSATGVSKTNVDSAINDLLLTTAGAYYLRVTGTSAVAYDLVVTKNAEFNIEPNNSTGQAQEVLSGQSGGSQSVLGHVGASGDLADLYKINLPAGGTVTAQTLTPADGQGEFTNALDPRLRILDSSGAALATNENGAADGRNALLSYTNNGSAALFYIEVAPTALTSATSGEYVLNVSGNVVTLPAFQVSATTPANGTVVGTAPTSFSVDFNDAYLTTSVQATDLLIDGSPAATGLTLIDGDSVRFALAPLSPGQHTFVLSAGSIQDLQGTPLTVFSGSLTIDTLPPKVTATSLAAGDTAPPGALTYQVTFSKPMKIVNLTTDDFSLKGTALNVNYSAGSYSYDATGTVLKLNYANLPEDTYMLTLVSGSSGGTNFTDTVGNALDGEFSGSLPSGDGFTGGNFVIGFNVDAVSTPFPTVTSKVPLGSLIYGAAVNSVISRTDDTDSFTLSLDAGQSVSVLVTPISATLQPAVEVRDPTNSLLATATATTAGAKVLLETLSASVAGTYTINISGVAGTMGAYAVGVTLNAALELEANGGAADDTLTTAQDIGSSFLVLPGTPATVSRGAVQGTTVTSTVNPDYYALQLNAGDTATIAVKSLTSGNLNVDLRNSNDVILAMGVSGSTNVTKVIGNFIATTTGSYYVRVTGDVGQTYDLVVTKNAAFDTEANDSFAAAQSLGASQSLLGYLSVGNEDWYIVGASGAGTLTIATATPSDGPNQFTNTLNPHIELYDPANAKVATGIPLADGRNESIQYQSLVAGNYRLRVVSDGGTSGEYAARIDGSVPVTTSFQVITTTPANNASVIVSPASFTIDFNRAYLATSVQAADLLIDGSPSATAVTLVDGDTLSFTLPPLADGPHTLSVAAAAVTDIQGTSLIAYSSTFTVDKTAPRVVASSVPQNGDTPTPTITLQLTFSEPMRTTNLSYSLYGSYPNNYPSSSATFDATGTVLTVVYIGYYGAMPDDNYTFTLPGVGCCVFTDLAGNALDGEFSGTFPSGDGVAGGDFVLKFRGDITTTPYAKSFNAMQPLGSLVYDTLDGGAYQSPNQISPAGDVDTYTLLVAAGQTISADLYPSNANGLLAALEVRDPNNNVIATATPVSGNPHTYLESAPAKISGTYTFNVSGVGNSTGQYWLWLRLNTATESETDGTLSHDDTLATAQNLDAGFASLAGAPNQVQQSAVMGIADGASGGSLKPDYYAFSLAAGETATFTITTAYGTSASNLEIDLRDSNDVQVATSLTGATNVKKMIRAFTVPAAGTYYVRVTGESGGYEYNLVITKNAEFSLEPNNTTAQAQSLVAPAINDDQWVIGYVSGGDPDVYKVSIAAGATLTAQTYLPGGGDGVFANPLDPRLRVLDANGNPVATDENSAPDGRNALLSFTNSGATATFYVEVAPTALVAATSGEYTLRINGNSAQLPAFQVVSTTPASGSSVNSAFTSLTVDFNRGYLATTIQLADLMIDGVPIATAVTLLDGDTASFSIPPLLSGQHSFGFAVGAIQDLQGMPLAAFTDTITIDSTPPTVIGTLPAPNGIALPGAVSYQFTFSEAMKSSNLSSDDFSLKSNTTNTTYTATSFSFNPIGTVLTLNYSNLPEDSYALTLVAGSTNGSNFTDSAGNALDGEFSGTFPSGNGTAGGNFVVTFSLDITSLAFPTPLTAKQPLGSLVYDGTTTGVIAPAGDSDSFSLNVDAGQTITVLVSPQWMGLVPAVELRDSAGNLLASSSLAASTPALLQTIPIPSSGTYQITVSGANNSTGSYKVAVTLNAALEVESNGGATNDTLASAQNIDASAVALDGNSTRLAILGSIGAGPAASGEDFESGVLPASFTTYSSNSFGRIRVIAPGGSGNSSKYALLLDSNTDSNYVLNEAVYHVNLAGVTQATLTFGHYQSTDEADVLPADFQGHANGDGVAISDDGTHWHTILNAPTNSTWTTATTDLAATAAAAGMKLGANFQIKFQQYDNFTYPTDGRAYDNIQIRLPDPQDTYQLTLTTGDQVTIVAKSLAGGIPSLQLLDASGTVLASGTTGPANVDVAIGSFLVPASGSYYLAVKGATGTSYSLLTTRNLIFDSEPNDSFAAAQKLGAAPAVLGSLGAGVTSNATVNAVSTGWWDSTGYHQDGNPIYFAGFKGAEIRDFFVFDLSSVTQAITAATLNLYNPDIAGVNGAVGYSSPDPTENFALFDVSTAPSLLTPGGSGQTAIFNDLGAGVSFGNQTVSAADNGKIVSIVLNAAGVATLNQALGKQMAIGGALTTISGTQNQYVFAYSSSTDVRQLALSFGPIEDWYSVDVSNALQPLVFTTSTPSDGAGQFANVLNPHIELYDPSGALIASGAILADGRNESIQYQPLVAGAYRVRVTSENGTTGEYVLSRSPVGSFSVDNLSAASPISEGDSTTLSGSFDDADTGSGHTVVVNWGGTEDITTLNLPAGVTSFQTTHTYSDDFPSGTASDNVSVFVTVTNVSSGSFGVGSTTVTVTNVPPTIQSLSPPAIIAENDALALTGTFYDPGTLDTHRVVIDWGATEGSTMITAAGPNPKGTTLTSLGAGNWQFTATHQYLDDNPTATLSDVYQIGVAVTDDDGGSDNDSTSVTVNNVAPTITGLGPGQSTNSLADPVASANVVFGRRIVANGPYVVVGSLHNVTQIFSASTGSLLRTLPVTGFDLAISGSTVAVHSQANEVKLFDAATGNLLRTINNPTTDLSGGFGYAVGISGNTLAVGASTDQNVGVISGAVYLFDVTTGNLLHTIYDPSPALDEHFGESVAISGNTLVVGAPLETVGGVEVGAAYLYDAATGNLISTLNNATPSADDLFGEQVAISENRVVVGAYLDDSGATDSGAAYLFDAASGNLLQTLMEPSPTAGDEFGYSLAISGNAIVVGGVSDDTPATNVGAAYKFDATTGKLLATLNNPVSAANEYFGAAVAISGNSIVVGAPNHDGAATDSGAAYLLKSSIGSVIQEDDSYVLTGTFHDAGTLDTHTISIHWSGNASGQPDEGTTTLTTNGPNPLGSSVIPLGGGDWQFIATHQYLDDNPSGTNSDIYWIDVNVIDDDGGSATASTSVTVTNAAPAITKLAPGRALVGLTNPNPQPTVDFGIAVAADDQYSIVGSDLNISVYDTTTGSLLRTIPAFGVYLALTGSTIVADGGDSVRLFDAATGNLLRTIDDPSPNNSNNFGRVLAASGNTLVVGASGDNTGAIDAGIAYVFDVTTGDLLHTFYNPYPVAYDFFGNSVAIDGNTIAISSGGGGVDESVYLLDATTGALLQTLTSPMGGNLGRSVAISGDRVVVSAPFADAGAKWSGLASVFDINTGALLYTLNNPNPADDDGFGWSVGASADVIVVGELKDDTVGTDSGAVYVFDTGTGALLETLTEPTQRAFAHFGTDVAVAGGKIVVGASGWGPSEMDSGTAFICDAVAQLTIDENGSFTLSGTFHDDGTPDTHTINIDWGGGGPAQPTEGTTVLTTAGPNPPGTSLISLGGGDWQFTATHLYADDNPAGTPSDDYFVNVTITDDDQGTAQGSTTVTVVNVAPAPTITNISSPRVEGTPIMVAGSAADPAGASDPITYAWQVFKASSSVAFATGNGASFSFTPDNDGEYRLELTATDDDGGVATTTQTITVDNVAPVANSLAVTLDEDTTVPVPLNATDVPTDSLTYVIMIPPQHGTLFGVWPNITYHPGANFNGGDSFTYRASDGQATGNEATVTLSVAPINDPPGFIGSQNRSLAYDENAATHGPALQKIVTGWAKNISAGPPDESSQALNFIVTNDNHNLFAVQPAVSPDGTLTYTPMPNANGSATVTIVLQDNGGGADTSQQSSFQIEIIKQHRLHNAQETGKRNGLDVTGSSSTQPDGFIVASDVLAVINYINAKGSGPIPANTPPGSPYPDVTGDDQVTAEDVIKIINYINANPGESEASSDSAPSDTDSMSAEAPPAIPDIAASSSAPSADLISLLAADTATAQLKRRRSLN